MLNGLVEISTTLLSVSSLVNFIAANSCLSPERMTTFGTECIALSSPIFSAGYAAQESHRASCCHNEVNGTEVTMNLNVAVLFT